MARTSKRTRASKGKTVSRARAARNVKKSGTSASSDAHLGVSRRAGYEFSSEALEQALRSGSHAGLLEDYFGEAAYRELRELALESSTTRRRGGPRVLILPGIMGSTLGVKKSIGLLDDVIWLDPVDIGLGHMTWLAPDSGHKLLPLGVILFTYLRLRLVLEHAGYDAEFYPFDWRRSIDELGAELASVIGRAAQSKIQLVAHSMGGLVARAALTRPEGKKVERLIQLGTPNYGSFVPVQALRGTAKVARAIAALDLAHSAEELAQNVFSKLPGLYQMLPSPERFSAIDLYSRTSWPKQGPQPDPELLRQVARVRQSLADADDRFTLIAGVNQETVTGLALGDREFQYESTRDGDGTVPFEFTQLPGIKTYTIEEEHGALPNNGTVCAAVVDLLSTGQTQRLESERRRGATRTIVRRATDSELTQLPAYEGRLGGELSSREVRKIAAQFVAPEASDRGTGTPTMGGVTEDSQAESVKLATTLHGIVVGRRKQRQLEIRLAHGSIVGVRARAYVIGIFNGVDPGGPAAAIDAALDGTLKEFTTRRMFSANLGEVFAVPTTDHLIHPDTVMLAGLGAFDQFGSEAQQLVAENVARSLVLTRIDDFATVLFGVGSGHTVASSLYNYLLGLLRGSGDADGSALRRVTLCEANADRFRQMKEELLRLAGTELFNEVQLTLDELEVPTPPDPVASRRATLQFDQPLAYLHVRREPGLARSQAFRSTLLTAGSKATVISGVKEVSEKELAEALLPITNESLTFGKLERFGTSLGELVLADDVRSLIDQLRQYHLVVVHDAPASRIPWETLCIKSSSRATPWFPAKEAGLSRRYIADNMSVSKWLEERRQDRVLKLLLIANPTEDLAGAETEAERVKALFKENRDVSITELRGAKATKPTVLAAFRSGEFDVLHYAGHAFFDASSPSHSGILCHNAQVLAGADLANLARLPSLVFFNACEAARIRKRGRTATAGTDAERRSEPAQRIEKNIGLAEAFLRGGVPNYIGTYWPVSDVAAEVFAKTFYGALLEGLPIGMALGRARLAVYDKQELDWADYVLYGSPDFVLKPRMQV